MAHEATTCVIWRITDGKRGHERQTQGLVQALGQLLPVAVTDIRAAPRWLALWYWLRERFPPGVGLAAPDLIVGAGHGTHFSMLAAQRAYGGKTIVLMKPSLPLCWFDQCLIPMHDAVRPAANVLTTRGAINAVQPTPAKLADVGLILIGGASAHYHWDDAQIAEQVRMIVGKAPQTAWQLTTSPRTPVSMFSLLEGLQLDNLSIAPIHEVSGDWLPEQLQQAAQVWVTPDSVSMLYEALTSGAAVGVFALKQVGDSRVARGVNALLGDGLVTGYADWLAGKALRKPSEEFNEAARCARWIKQNWFPEN